MTDLSENSAPDNAKAIIHRLALASVDTSANRHTFYDFDNWSRVARELMREGYDWPVLDELAKVCSVTDISEITDEQSAAIEKLVPSLIDQTVSGTPWPYWDMICAIIGRQWSLEQQSQGVAEAWPYASLMDSIWYTVRDIPEDQETAGTKLIWRGMGLSELVGFQDINQEMTEVLEEAQKLGPSVPFDAQTCKVILEGTY